MTNGKCLNCGAIVKREAKFCPECGTVAVVEPVQPVQPPPVQPQPVQPPPVQRQPVQPQRIQPRAMIETVESLLSKKFIIAGALIGILLAWIGTIVGTFATDLTLTRAALILNNLGFTFIGLFLLVGGIANKNFDKFVRLGMIVGGAITIGMGISIS